MSSIRISSWNVQGLVTRTHNKLQCHSFVDSLKQHDIVGLVETHMKPDDSITIEGYSSYSKCRLKNKRAVKYTGGIAVVFKQKLRNGVKIIDMKDSEFLWVKLCKEFFKYDQDIYIGIIYINPINSTFESSKNFDSYECLEKEITKFSALGNVILMGDFNARTSIEADYIIQDDAKYLPLDDNYITDEIDYNRYSYDRARLNQYGHKLLEICKSTGLRILNGRLLGDSVGKFTCHQPSGSSVVDYGLVHHSLYSLVNYFKVHKFNIMHSDHCQISFELKSWLICSDTDENLKKIPNRYIWTEISKEMYANALRCEDIQADINDIIHTKTNNVNNLALKLNNIMHKAADRALKIRKYKSKKKRIQKKWFNDICYRERQNLMKLGNQLDRKPFDRLLRTRYFEKKKYYHKILRKSMKTYRADVVDNINESKDKNPQIYWNLLTDLKQDINTQTTDKSKNISGDEWQSYFSKLFSNENCDNKTAEIVKNVKLPELEKEKVYNELSFRIEISEISKAIKALKNHKAVGLDCLSNEMIKAGENSLINPILKLFNCILSSGNYPEIWTTSYIKPIHKVGNPLNPSNFRGISIMNCIAKLFSIVLNNRLKNFIDKNNLIKEVQIAHKKGCRTTDHIFVLKTLIDQETKINKSKLYACFVDFHKAFDSINRDLLLYKLLHFGIGGNFYQVIKNMYYNITSCVKIGNNLTTDFFKCLTGVRQGDVLSPLLFNLFVNDLPDIFEDSCFPPHLNDLSVNCLMYADDLVILSKSKEGLQTSLAKLNDYCNKWSLSINRSKTKVMIFNPSSSSRTENSPQTKFQLGNTIVETVDSYKYLGIQFSVHNNFDNAVSNMLDKSRKAMFKLSKIITNEELLPSTGLRLFDQLIKPILTYGAEIWGCFGISASALERKEFHLEMKYEKQKCEKLQYSFCKMLLNIHKKSTNLAVLGELGRYPLYIDIIHSILKYWQRFLDLDHTSLLYKAFEINIADDYRNSFSWSTFVRNILKVNNLQDSLTQKVNIQLIYNKLKIRYQTFWKNSLKQMESHNGLHGNKLRTYNKFKHELKYEPYLNIIPSKQDRTFLTSFRISAHNLAIERLRYSKTRILPIDRICTFCDDKVPEDELHFLMTCNNYTDLRDQLMSNINCLTNISDLTPGNKFISIMSSEVPVIVKAVAKFVRCAMQKREIQNLSRVDMIMNV